MLRVHARSVAANVVDNVPIRDGAGSEEQGDAMSPSIGAAKSDDAVSITVLISQPDVTVANLRPL